MTPPLPEPQVRLSAALLSAGLTHAPARLVVPKGRGRLVMPALFAHLEHPAEGHGLFDTGYSPRFFEGTARLPQRLYRYLTPVTIPPSLTAAAQLKARGVEPSDVRWIVLSHFDPDHYGGLADFPHARIYVSWRAWRAVAPWLRSGSAGRLPACLLASSVAVPEYGSVGRCGGARDSSRHSSLRHSSWLERLTSPLASLALLRERVLPHHLPADLEARLHLIPDPDGPGFGPFAHAHDLFGDGSVRLVSLPGHQPGQLGALVRAKTQDLFLAADAVWSRTALAHGFRGLHFLVARDKVAQAETLRRLSALRDAFPSLSIIPCHCRDAARDHCPTFEEIP